MHGPNVKRKFAQTLSKDRTENGLSNLIDIATCPLHVINGTFQTGSVASSQNLNKTLKAEWQIIHDSPVRREDCMSVTSSSVYPLLFCATRWVEKKKFVCRPNLLWAHIVQIVRFLQKVVPSKQPKCKSYSTLKKAASDMLMIPKLQFSTYVASVLQPFL